MLWSGHRYPKPQPVVQQQQQVVSGGVWHSQDADQHALVQYCSGSIGYISLPLAMVSGAAAVCALPHVVYAGVVLVNVNAG